MNAAVMMENCPGAETLAAYSDGMLDAQSREELTQHLADCGVCQDLLVDLDAAKRELAEGNETVVRPRFGSGVVPVLAAAAAVLVVLFGVPAIRERLLGGNPMRELVAAANALPERPTAARLSGDFAHRRHRAYRGGSEEAEYAVQLAAARAAEEAEKNRSAANLHAAGVGSILLNDRAAAIQQLEDASRANPKSAAILTDLAAAYIERGAGDDYRRALDAADKAVAIKRTPAALWNRALALDRLGETAAAIEAWNQYLTDDPSSPWAAEASESLQDLREH